ncbi:hypothetical protein TPE_2760 [Treponema pedis str. T A4]|uniref:Uncharacterized protein n=1 Tax=Treponema pedis str. T A4 TaxID=1291379 RepID=S5ZRB3_9SPIR|nr:hypothetical protein TPE_2760 [Treponema pedis str. T A4]
MGNWTLPVKKGGLFWTMQIALSKNTGRVCKTNSQYYMPFLTTLRNGGT